MILREISKSLAKVTPGCRQDDILSSAPVAIGESMISSSSDLDPIDISRVLDGVAILELLDQCSFHVDSSRIFV